MLQTVAGVILDEQGGSLAEQALRLTSQPTRLPGFTPSLSQVRIPEPTPSLQPPADLLMENGLGGFSRDGREYILHLRGSPGSSTGRGSPGSISQVNRTGQGSPGSISQANRTGTAGQHTPQPWVNYLSNGRLVALIGVAPLRPAEFVIFRIGQWTADH